MIFSKKPIIDIALLCGYQSQQSFTAAFKSMYKAPPAEYRVNRNFYPLQLRFTLEKNPPKEPLTHADICLATESDIVDWMTLMHLTIDGYPEMNEDDYLFHLRTGILENRALILRHKDLLIGAMLFSRTTTLLRFAAPTIFMMLFMGLYTIVDILFVARFVGTDALSAINIVCPVTNLIVGLGTMLAIGGNAILSRKMGACMHQEAKEDFTLLILAGTLMDVCLFAIGTLSMTPLLQFLGASPRLMPSAQDYLWLMLLFAPASMLQTLFASLFVTTG